MNSPTKNIEEITSLPSTRAKLEVQKLTAIENLCRGPMGIYKRIDENREFLEFLQKNAPLVLETFPCLKGWIANTDMFYANLRNLLDLPETDFRGGPHWPRKWPDSHAYFE